MVDDRRRQYLKGVAALGGLGAVGGLSGCSQLPIPGVGSGGSVPAYYRDWLFEPGTLTDREHYGFRGMQPSVIDENEDEFEEETFEFYEQFEDRVSYLDVDFDDMQNVTRVANDAAIVITGDYDVEDVTDELEDEEFESQTETNGYEIFVNGETMNGVAVSSDALVSVSAPGMTATESEQPAPPGEAGPATGPIQQNLRSIQFGQTLGGTIDQSDPEGHNGFYEPVTFSGSSGQTVTITMRSEGDTYLMLEDPSGSIVTENDDGGDGLNSEIADYTLQSDGEYTIIATSFNSGATFEYQLSLAEAGAGAGGDLRSISYGETATGAIDADDPTGYRGNYEPVTFEGSAGDVVTIDMVSEDDPYLILLDPDGNEIARNDDAFGLNSRIARHTLPTDGEYTIVATSFGDRDTFPYTLRVVKHFSAEELVPVVESVVGVANGDTPLYTDSASAADTLVSALGGGTFVSGQVYEPMERDQPEQGLIEDSVGRGSAFTVDGDTASVTAVVAFEDSGDAETDGLEDWFDEASRFEDVDDESFETQGSAAVMTGTIDTDDI